MDFTIKKYNTLLEQFVNSDYKMQRFVDYIQNPVKKSIILRHDVDLLPENSYFMARIQKDMGIQGSYYFRAVPESWNELVIEEIAKMGHEVGYHYENMDMAYGRIKGKRRKYKVERNTQSYDDLIDVAYEDFCLNLERLRKLVPVKTICMHGSPRSQFDNKEIWTKYNYKSLGLIGEPYYDVDFDKVFYLTDTGRRWDGWKTSVRDKVPQQEEWIKQGLVFHSTRDIIDAFNRGRSLSQSPVLGRRRVEMPNQIMFTMHPQRWHNKTLPWAKELLLQNIKNQIKKRLLVK